MRFNRSAGSMLVSFRVVVVSGSPEDRTRHNLVISKAWTTSPRLPSVVSKVGHLGVKPPVAEPLTNENSLLVPNQACFHLHLYPMLCYFHRRSVYCRRISSLSVGREALESSSAVLQTAARPSQLPAHIGFVVGVARCNADTKKGSMPV